MRIPFLNTEIDNLTMQEAIDEINVLVKKNNHSYVVTPNLDHIVLIEKDSEFKRAYENADLILTDGKPLIWISRLLKNPIKEKVSGSDLFPRVCELAAQNGYSIFILGAMEGVAQTAANKLIKSVPRLSIAGCYSPPVGFEKDSEEVKKIINMINSSNADILAVALGAPKGEKFIYQIRDKISVAVSMQIGATIDFIAGRIKRAPKWMSDYGLEWLYRIFQDPKRLLKRYVRDACEIIPIIIRYSKRKRNSNKNGKSYGNKQKK